MPDQSLPCFDNDANAYSCSWAKPQPVDLRSPGHIAFECDSETQQGIKARLEANGHPLRVTDHGYCLSLYVNDPNN